MLILPTVYDDGPTLNQHWLNVFFLPRLSHMYSRLVAERYLCRAGYRMWPCLDAVVHDVTLLSVTRRRRYIRTAGSGWRRTDPVWNHPCHQRQTATNTIQINRGRVLVQVTIYRRLLIGRDGHLDQSEAYDYRNLYDNTRHISLGSSPFHNSKTVCLYIDPALEAPPLSARLTWILNIRLVENIRYVLSFHFIYYKTSTFTLGR